MLPCVAQATVQLGQDLLPPVNPPPLGDGGERGVEVDQNIGISDPPPHGRHGGVLLGALMSIVAEGPQPPHQHRLARSAGPDDGDAGLSTSGHGMGKLTVIRRTSSSRPVGRIASTRTLMSSPGRP